MDGIRLNDQRRDEQIDWVCAQIRAMGRLSIPLLCYNWHAITA